jgi:hypothetical protein
MISHPKRPRDPNQLAKREYAIGKGHSVSVMWRGGEVDTIFGFEREADALEWIKEKSQIWLIEHSRQRPQTRP